MKIDFEGKYGLPEAKELVEEAMMILHCECVDNADTGLIGRRSESDNTIESKKLNSVLQDIVSIIEKLDSGVLKVNIDGSVKQHGKEEHDQDE